VSARLASALKKWVLRMVPRDVSQPGMRKVEVVERNQRHGEVVGGRGQLGSENCGEVCLAAALWSLNPHHKWLVWFSPSLKVSEHMSQHVTDGGLCHGRETREEVSEELE
jgi:hypothetical protein